MSIIEWTDELSVGIASIDKQHQILIKLINSLNTAMATGQPNIAIADILVCLTDYTRVHFSYEESLLEKYGYKETKNHQRQHRELIEQIAALKERFQSDLSGSIGIEIMQFLKNWLTHHIMKTDKAYSVFLISKGVI